MAIINARSLVFRSTPLLNVVGGFANNNYWSSTEYDNNNAWKQNFNNGNQNNNNPNNTNYVRAVRGFKLFINLTILIQEALKLVIPKNIKLVCIPPYSPELNPSEKIWWKMKRAFTGKLHKVPQSVSDFITDQVNVISKDSIKSICGFEYILSCPVWAKTKYELVLSAIWLKI